MIEKLMYHHVRKAIPQVYEDSLSYYELILKILAKLDEVIDEANEMIETQLHNWLEDGTLEAIINDQIFKNIVVDTTYLIPSDYPTLQEAVDDVLGKTVGQGVKIELKIESGFSPSKGITVSHADCSHIRITSVSPVVQVGNDFTGDFIAGEYSTIPTLACMVDMRDKGEDGISCAKGSRGIVEYWCGVRNAGQKGCYVAESSQIYARAAEFTGSNDRNVWVTRTSSFEGEIGNFSANKGGDNAVYVSRSSTANLLEADIRNPFNNGVAVIRSTVNAESVNVSGAGGSGIIAQRGSRVSAEFVNATGCAENGIIYQSGSFGSINGSDVSGSKVGLRVSGSNVYANSLIARNNPSFGAWVSSGSVADMGSSIIEGGLSSGVYVSDASTVNLNGATIDDNTLYGLRVETCSTVNAVSSKIRRNGSGDVRTAGGSTINAYNCETTNGVRSVGDHSVLEFNTIHGSNGIIYA